MEGVCTVHALVLGGADIKYEPVHVFDWQAGKTPSNARRCIGLLGIGGHHEGQARRQGLFKVGPSAGIPALL